MAQLTVDQLAYRHQLWQRYRYSQPEEIRTLLTAVDGALARGVDVMKAKAQVIPYECVRLSDAVTRLKALSK